MSKVTIKIDKELKRIMKDIGGIHNTLENAKKYLKQQAINNINNDKFIFAEECIDALSLLNSINSYKFDSVYKSTFK